MLGKLLLFAALAALGAVLVEWRLMDREEIVSTPAVARPGYYLRQVDMMEFATDGQPRIGVQAASATEEPASGQVTLSQVTVDFHARGNHDWRLTAAEARVPRSGSVVEFAGDVRVRGEPADTGESAELRTAHLTLDTDREFARTSDPVTLAFGRHEMRALGLKADLKAGSLRLESDVNGLLIP